MKIIPFNRNSHHLEMIRLHLVKLDFFEAHPNELIKIFAQKVVLLSKAQI